jgi:hypothetical protein
VSLRFFTGAELESFYTPVIEELKYNILYSYLNVTSVSVTVICHCEFVEKDVKCN